MRQALILVCATLTLTVPGAASIVTLSFTGDLRINATFTDCGTGCTLGPANSDADYAQYAAVVESFNVAASSSMNAITFSYGGGTKGAGKSVAQGEFETYLGSTS